MEERPLSITITPGTVVMAVTVSLLVWLLFYLQSLVLIVLTAVVLASAVEPGVAWFMRYRIHRVFAVALVYLIIFGVLFGVSYAFLPPLIGEVEGFISRFPEFLASLKIDTLLSQGLLGTATQAVTSDSSLTDTLLQFREAFTASGEGAFRVLSSIFGGVVSFVLMIVLSVYFAAQETGIDDFLRVITPVKHQEYAIDLWKRSHYKIGLWMQGQLLLSLIMGILAYLWLTILGVPYAIVLALIVAIAELVPIFGPIISGVIAVAVAASSGDTTPALLVAGGFVILQQLESHLIYPLVVKKVVGVAPLLVILALVAGSQLAGFIGILLSVPIAAAIQEFVSDVQRSKERELARMRE